MPRRPAPTGRPLRTDRPHDRQWDEAATPEDEHDDSRSDHRGVEREQPHHDRRHDHRAREHQVPAPEADSGRGGRCAPRFERDGTTRDLVEDIDPPRIVRYPLRALCYALCAPNGQGWRVVRLDAAGETIIADNMTEAEARCCVTALTELDRKVASIKERSPRSRSALGVVRLGVKAPHMADAPLDANPVPRAPDVARAAEPAGIDWPSSQARAIAVAAGATAWRRERRRELGWCLRQARGSPDPVAAAPEHIARSSCAAVASGQDPDDPACGAAPRSSSAPSRLEVT